MDFLLCPTRVHTHMLAYASCVRPTDPPDMPQLSTLGNRILPSSAPSIFVVSLVIACLACFGCNDSSSSSTKTSDASQKKPAKPESLETGTASNQASSTPKTGEPRDAKDAGTVKSKTGEFDFEQRFNDAAKLLEENKPDDAWKIARELTISNPNHPKVLFLAARIKAKKQDLKAAIALVSKIPEDDPEAGGPALGQWAEWLAESGDLVAAEAKILKLIKQYPTATPAIRLLIRIYNAQGRRWETSRFLERLVRLGDFTTAELSMGVDFREPYFEKPFHEAAMKADPDQPYNRFYELRTKIFDNKFNDCIAPLEIIVSKNPDLLEPWVWLGLCYYQTERIEQLRSWIEKKPATAPKHPEYWFVLGAYLLSQEQVPQAARAFAECIRLDRRHVASQQGLADCLLRMGMNDEAQRVRKISNDLIHINDTIQQILFNYVGSEGYDEVAQTYLEVGEPLPAFGWTALRLARDKKPFPEELKEQQKQLRDGKIPPPKVLEGLPVNSWPLPDGQALPTINQPTDDENRTSSDDRIVMEDVASERNVTCVYHNGEQPDRGWFTHEGIGGGVSALDYDSDGWPDLFFSEAGGTPLKENEVHYPKLLYRSMRGERFVEVAHVASVADRGYGQGTGTTDIDQDGLPDLLVANIGNIALFRNQGDGTFEQLPIHQNEENALWNSSINAADINGDSLPDIIQGAYAHGTEPLTRWCGSPGSKKGSCNPKTFPPGKNRLLYNDGTGGWLDADPTLLDSIRHGYTLGTLITNVDQAFGNDVYFANDVSPNHFLISRETMATPEGDNGNKTSTRHLVENAGPSGVAADALGRAQASMGIACGDQNRDGKLDIVVTNFRDEPSTLYLQTIPGVFSDGTRRSRLGIPTFDWVSFGCQLTDLDDDGWLDFIAVNGHIDDYQDGVTPFKMPSQILKNNKGQFAWLQNPSPGKYFDTNWIGRGLSSLDYNRDGKMDMVATHLDRPAALLENRTSTSNHYVQFELVGTKSERDAIGAVVHVKSGDEQWVASMSAGEGYFGSNQHLIHVGVGKRQKIDSITVRWPSGLEETYSDLAIDKSYLAIEAQGIALSVR